MKYPRAKRDRMPIIQNHMDRPELTAIDEFATNMLCDFIVYQ
jgi:hypothetical protein